MSSLTNPKPLTAEDAAQLEPAQPTASFSNQRKAVVVQGIAFLLGLALLIYVVRKIGAQPIFDALSDIGVGIILVILTSGARHLLRTCAMRLAVDPAHRKLTLMQAFGARLGGEAVAFLTFTGPLLGEATKVALLKKRVPLTQSVAALVMDNLIYNLSVVLFILSGAVVMLVAYPLPRVVALTLFAIALIATLAIVVILFAATKKLKLLTWIIQFLGRPFTPRFIFKKQNYIAEIETTIYDFYAERRGAFFGLWAWNFVAHSTSVLEIYVTLRLLGLTPHLHQAYIIESLTKVINFVFGFIPATVGVYETGTVFILRTLGFTSALGLALALARKAAMIFWNSIGLLILARRAVTHGTRQLFARSPRLQKTMDNLIFSNIAHRPARTFVSVLGIGIGVLLVVFTVGLANGVLNERAKREANVNAEIRVQARGSTGLTGNQPFKLPLTMAQELAKIEGVRAAVPLGQRVIKSDRGGVLSGGNRLVDGIDFDAYSAMTGMHLVAGQKLIGGDEAVVDTQWQKDNRAKLGDKIKIYDRDFTIVGFYEPASGGRVKIPLTTMQTEVGGEGFCSAILVACDDPAQQDLVEQRINEQFEVQTIQTRNLTELYSQSLPALKIFTRVIVGVAASISLLIILLAMYTTVTERTRQIGILKALGMSNTKIAWIIEQEALLVSALGVVTGIVLALMARAAVMRTTSLVVEIEPRWILISLVVGLLGGTIGALYPALRAARQDAVAALSYE